MNQEDLPSTLSNLIYSSARQYQLSPELIAAIIYQESKGYQYASRYEPQFYTHHFGTSPIGELIGHKPALISFATELKDRATSFGLMQLLGESMREFGFNGEALSELFDIQTNLEWGCRFFKHLRDKSSSDEEALLRWNGGGNPNYPKQVLSHIQSRKIDLILK